MKCLTHSLFYNIQIFQILFLFKYIYNILISPFDTIYINDETIIGNDYHDKLFQNELYINMSIGTPIQFFKSILKMDKYGFIIYEDAFNQNLSSTYEIIEENLKISWIWSFISFPSKDYFYFPYFNTYNNFKKNKNNKLKYDIIKTNKTAFLRIHIKNLNVNNFNKMFHNYGIIGLQLDGNINFNPPEFVVALKNSESINSYTFSLKFENNNKLYNNDNKGYFIIGEEFKENDKILYTSALKYGGEIMWATFFDNIYSNNNQKSNNYSRFYSNRKQGNFFVNYPYILGTLEYNEFIYEAFFKELIEQNICYMNNKINNDIYFSYICDSTSKIFMNNLNNFPDLIFKHRELGQNFTLTKNDLFSYNNFNTSDKNLYFLIMFANLKGKDYVFNWILGIPFLKKYRLVFNYDTKQIGYFEYDNEIIQNKNIKNRNILIVLSSIYFKIIYIVILIFIIFVLGMIYQRKIIKIPRKIKANELDDNYEYNSNKNNKINDINNYNNRNINQKDIELGIKLID